MTGAVQHTARNLLACGESLEPLLKERLEGLATAQLSGNPYEALAALQALHDLSITSPVDHRSPQAITRRLAEVVWHYTFMHYFWLKELRNKDQSE
jgi:hypothetical protein